MSGKMKAIGKYEYGCEEGNKLYPNGFALRRPVGSKEEPERVSVPSKVSCTSPEEAKAVFELGENQ
ncbi:hypothetical protein NMR34_003421 [Vibrio cholerae]|nr:hypothetical protein [Vibrio cholerae]